MKVGEKIEPTIENYTDEGEGISWTDDGNLILIDGISVDDLQVRAEVTSVSEFTIKAKKISRITSQTSEIEERATGPYELDDDEEAEDEDDEDY